MARNNEPGQGKSKTGTSGSGKTSRYQRQSSDKPARWGLVDGAALTDMLDALQSAGDAAIFGITRDGGVLVLTICSGDERAKYYAKTEDEMDAHMAEVTGMARNLQDK